VGEPPKAVDASTGLLSSLRIILDVCPKTDDWQSAKSAAVWVIRGELPSAGLSLKGAMLEVLP
jgi:hypothetical protein